MSFLVQQARRGAASVAALHNLPLFLIVFAAVALSHFTLLRLPYYWDEGGYYIPAALDFYHRFTLIPEYTNAHPPLPNVVLGSLWHLFGYHLLTTRLIICGFAAAGLLGVFRLALVLLRPEGALTTTVLTAVYPIWFVQSTLAHADIFAAAFTLWAFALYFSAQRPAARGLASQAHRVTIAALFALAALSKETAVIQPATLLAYHLFVSFRQRRAPSLRAEHLRWALTLSLPLLPLMAWYAYHRAVSGFTFGNPEYLRYNATANFTASHILSASRYRFVHLAWQRNMWVPLITAVACLVFKRKREPAKAILLAPATTVIALLVIANWLAFSVLGGALLTRYLLPVYPLILIACMAVWRAYTPSWLALATLTAASFLVALWWSAPAAYAPEDSLTYRDMIVVHQQAIAFIDQQYPDARVLTSWPAAAELYRPDLGYTDRKIMGPEIDNFSAAEIEKAAGEPGSFDTALVFSKNFIPPNLRHYLTAHPNSARGRDFMLHRDLTPEEIAVRLGGQIVFQRERNGEWAAVLRFPRSYDAELRQQRLAGYFNLNHLGHDTLNAFR